MLFLSVLGSSFYLLGDHLGTFPLLDFFYQTPDILAYLRFEIYVHMEGHRLCLSNILLFRVGINSRVGRSFSEAGRLSQIQILGIIEANNKSFPVELVY